jgi:hypothetical protein
VNNLPIAGRYEEAICCIITILKEITKIPTVTSISTILLTIESISESVFKNKITMQEKIIAAKKEIRHLNPVFQKIP